MSIRVVAALILLGVAIPMSLAAQGRTPADYMAAIEGVQATAGPNGLGNKTLEELMAEFGVPGVTVAVIRDFEVHWAKGYGVADVETGAPVDTETMFQAASISKPVTAMAVLRAVQDGLFALDDDINDILESWKLDGGSFTRDRPVTPRSLTSHTSGLGDGFGFPGYDPADPLPTVIQILDGHELSNVGPVFMERAPMSFEEYSGGGVIIMQQALTDARGRRFADIMRDDVLQPVGMTNSSFVQPISPENDRNAARAHDGEGRSRGAKWHVYPEQAAAGLWTTALRSFSGEMGCTNELLVIPTGCRTSSRMISANRRPRASVNACCMTVTPPPEYSSNVIGARSMKTGPTLDSSCPSRI